MASSTKKSQEQKKSRLFQFVLVGFLLIGLLAAMYITMRRSIPSGSITSSRTASSNHIQMDLVAFGENRRLANTDTLSSPNVTIFGNVHDYQTMKAMHPGLEIIVNGTSVAVKLNSGEFVQPVVLQSGENVVGISVKWEDRVRESFSYDLTYQPASSTIR